MKLAEELVVTTTNNTIQWGVFIEGERVLCVNRV